MRAHDRPEVRKVEIGSRMVPYWEAGAAYLPSGQGYFQNAMAMTWAFQPAAESGAGGFGGVGDHGGDHHRGFDGGGGDGGGM